LKIANNYIYKKINDIEACATNHGVGQKKIFVGRSNCRSNITQAAFGELKSGEKIEQHAHPTMEEFYYFESGKLNFHIADEMLCCEAGDFVMVPAGVKHFLEAQNDCTFIYWGVST